MPTSSADRADLLALRTGDERALERLIARWEQALFAYAWRYLRNAADARELAIETFVRLHQHRARLRDETNLSAWLFTTLTNLCHNRHRWSRRHPSLSLDAPANGGDGNPAVVDSVTAETRTPGDALERREELERLDSAVAALPHELRVTILLHHFEGLSYREIAEITGCAERGVETRLYRARQRLRDALTALPVETGSARAR